MVGVSEYAEWTVMEGGTWGVGEVVGGGGGGRMLGRPAWGLLGEEPQMVKRVGAAKGQTPDSCRESGGGGVMSDR